MQCQLQRHFLRVPSILIAGEDKDKSIIKSSDLNTGVQQSKQAVEHQADIISRSASVAPGISADKIQVDKIIRNLENDLSHQPLRQCTRLNAPPVQNPEPKLRHSKQLKQQAAIGIEDYDAEVTLAMTSIANQIRDPPTVEAAKKLEDWPKWQALIENELNIHKMLGTGEIVTPPLNDNIVGS